MSWPFRILLALNIAYCCLGLVTKQIPAWRMFEKVDPMDFSVVDSSGHLVEVKDYLPASAYITSTKSLLQVLSFICKRGQHPLPLVFTEKHRSIRLEIGPEQCKVPHDI